MRIYKIDAHQSANKAKNNYGETALPNAPEAALANGQRAVPQQFLQVQRSRESLEHIVADIAFNEQYPLFVGQDNATLYLQAGVIGKENYPRTAHQRVTPKIVYGRKWLIEVNTPTSEVVQTALLALKKIREHEIREKFFFRTRNNNTTTPFNSHMDLPLMADNAELFTTAENQKQNPLTEDSLRELLSRVTISTLSVQLKSQLSLSGNRHLLELSVIGNAQTEHAFAELLNQDLNIIVDNLSKAQVLHQLLNELIAISDRWVEEHFLFNGFARFSRTQCPERIGEFSLATRQVAHPNSHFSQCYKKMTYQVDFDRKPAYASARSKLGRKQRQQLANHPELEGHLPQESVDTIAHMRSIAHFKQDG